MSQETTTNPALAELRGILKDKFATAHRDYTPRESIVCGVDWIDAIGLEKGSLCEISNHNRSLAGGAVVLAQMIQHIIRERQRLVLIDGTDSFDPAMIPAFGADLDPSQENPQPGGHDMDGSFVWARCRSVSEAVKVADMILRDGNLPRTVIDLQRSDPKEIRAIPASSWLRLRTLTEDSGVSSIIMTPSPSVNCAAMRFEIDSHFDLDDLETPEFIWRQKSRGKLGRSHRPAKASSSDSKMLMVG